MALGAMFKDDGSDVFRKGDLRLSDNRTAQKSDNN
jgi:hypothetical protein